jgi:hypothetical protein
MLVFFIAHNRFRRNMSASTSLPSIRSLLVRYLLPSNALLGCLGNMLILLLFYRHRQNACANYLSGAAAMNMLYLATSVALHFYTSERGDPSLHSFVFCKVRSYFLHVWRQVPRYFTVLGCIDRYALTHTNTHIRSFSQIKMVWMAMITTTVFWHIFLLHIIIMVTVKERQCTYFGLYFILNNVQGCA